MGEMQKKLPYQILRESILDKYGKPISQTELAHRLSKICPGVNRQKIANIEKGEKRVDADIMKAYMQYFHVSSDYLLGFSDTRKGFDADLISCADYLGVDRLTVDHIRKMTQGKTDLKHTDSNFYNSDYIDRLNQIAGLSGFSFDCLLSSFNSFYDSDCIGLFYAIYGMIQSYVRHYDDIKAWKQTGKYNPDIYSYKGLSVEMCNAIFTFIENLDFEQIKQRAKEYDARNNSNIYFDLFGDGSGPGL